MVGSTGMSGNQVPRGYKMGQVQNYTPAQMDLLQRRFDEQANSPMQGIARGDEGSFDQLEAPAMRQFGQMQGQNASRFSGMGMGSRRGSGFNNTQNSSAMEFAERLQAQRLGLMRQAQQDLWGMGGDLLNAQPYQNFMVQKAPKKPTFMQNLIGGAAPIVGGIVGGLAGGPMGAAAGASAGSTFSSAFSGQPAQQSDWSSIAQLPTSWGQGGGGGGGGVSNLRYQAQGISG